MLKSREKLIITKFAKLNSREIKKTCPDKVSCIKQNFERTLYEQTQRTFINNYKNLLCFGEISRVIVWLIFKDRCSDIIFCPKLEFCQIIFSCFFV